MRVFLAIAILVVVVLFGISAAFTVDRTEYAYVTQFGQHVATFDGAIDGGLHWKLPWPIQSVQRIDSRLQYFDLPETELLTHDETGQTIDKTITVVAYVCWRIPDQTGVDWFIRRIGQTERVRSILGDHIRGQLGAALGRLKMEDLFSTEPGRVERNLEMLRNRVLEDGQDESLRASARREYGIDIVDIRLRRTSHPEAVRQAIFTRIRSEREKKAAEYESEGRKQAQNITSAAERKASDIRSEARAQEKKLRGQADAEADYIRNQANSKDPEFYAFLKKLEEYQKILGDNKTMLLLSSHRELFDLLFQPPRPGNGTAPAHSTPATKDKK